MHIQNGLVQNDLMCNDTDNGASSGVSDQGDMIPGLNKALVPYISVKLG